MNSATDKISAGTEMLNAFFQEASDFIEAIESNLLALLSIPDDYEKIADSFRLIHSLKGNAGFMEQRAIEKLSHAMEFILDALKSNCGSMEPRTGHLLLEAVDQLKLLIGQQVEGNIGELDTLLENLAAELLLLAEVPRMSAENQEKLNSEDNFWDESSKTVTDESNPSALLALLTELQKIIYQLEQPDNHPANSKLLRLATEINNCKPNYQSRTITVLLKKITGICSFYGSREINIPADLLYLLSDLTDLLDGSLLNLQAGNSPEIDSLDQLMAPLDEELKKVNPELIALLNTVPQAEAANREIPEDVQTADRDKTRQPDSSFRQTDIRVNLDKLDKLLDLTGELVIAGSLIMNSRQLGEDELEKAVESLNRVIRDLQETTMNMRLLPFSLLFGRMQKLVYSVARKAGKKVRLQISGENTEVDKSLLEAVSDPLVHLIRNAIDHGIETEEERLAAGKTAEGLIRLTASMSGSEINLLVADDGRGLNFDRIRTKAIERGLLDPAAELTEDEMINLLFLPGFSTAGRISEISGRGVGMDVVKQNLEKIKGRIKINSQPGFGTEVRLTIPLTLTIMEGLLIRTGKSQYIIPLDCIIETFIAAPEEITIMPDGTEFVRKRNLLYPVKRLHRIHSLTGAVEQLSAGIQLLVKDRDNQALLFIDEIVGQETTVVKSLPDYLGSLSTVSGCAILGNGEICQILNIPAIIEHVSII